METERVWDSLNANVCRQQLLKFKYCLFVDEQTIQNENISIFVFNNERKKNKQAKRLHAKLFTKYQAAELDVTKFQVKGPFTSSDCDVAATSLPNLINCFGVALLHLATATSL